MDYLGILLLENRFKTLHRKKHKKHQKRVRAKKKMKINFYTHGH